MLKRNKHMDIPEKVQQFYKLSKDYCQWAENGPGPEESEVFTALYFVSALYNQALSLPDVEPSDDDHDDLDITKVESEPIYKRFASIPFQLLFGNISSNFRFSR